jgi:hypothetical protein
MNGIHRILFNIMFILLILSKNPSPRNGGLSRQKGVEQFKAPPGAGWRLRLAPLSFRRQNVSQG